ncbi:hypothetical protein MTR67_023952 [Solanum verrucosum]|uniref:Uncharacterized protein n=1 Tax=Solanum verrucosum TaxID=315347 RepID=A0AAF0QUI3_SOLVR|nr:hypothetical protein MTR67_023952 [Solanum verrucosum]
MASLGSAKSAAAALTSAKMVLHTFQLAYSYISCTDASWPASFDDADSVFVLLGCCGVCPNIHLSILEAS